MAVGAVVVAAAILAGAPARAAEPAHITGTVTGSGGPLAGVTVTALHRDGGGWAAAGNDTTNGAGAYDIAIPDDGDSTNDDYTLEFYDGLGQSAGEYWDDVSTLADATTFPVPAGTTVGGKDADLAPGRHIRGTVRGPGNVPLAGIEVSAYPSQAVGGEQVLVEFDVADAQGGYDISRLPAGTYRIGFRDVTGAYLSEYWTDKADLASADDINVAAGDADGRDAVLAAAGQSGPPIAPAQPVVNSEKPAISGTPRVGRKLKVSAGAWSPGAVTLSYQWLANGRPIRGATGARLKLKGAQLRKKISVQVTATAPGRTATTATTVATKKVKPRSSRR